jgi:L-lysine 2,3-aminomutase
MMEKINTKADWQSALSNAISDPAELLAELSLDEALLPAAQAAARLFPLQVPQIPCYARYCPWVMKW